MEGRRCHGARCQLCHGQAPRPQDRPPAPTSSPPALTLTLAPPPTPAPALSPPRPARTAAAAPVPPGTASAAGDPQVPAQHGPAHPPPALCPRGAGDLPELHAGGGFPLAGYGFAGPAGGGRDLPGAPAGGLVPVRHPCQACHPLPQGHPACPAHPWFARGPGLTSVTPQQGHPAAPHSPPALHCAGQAAGGF